MHSDPARSDRPALAGDAQESAGPHSLEEARRPTLHERLIALLEVILCSDYPTQIALGATLGAFGFHPQTSSGSLAVGYIVTVSLLDTIFLVGLMVMFLRAHDESPRQVFLGSAPVRQEIWRGVPLTFAALFIAVTVLVTIQLVAPWLRTVQRNPMQDLVRTPFSAALFAIVVVIAGGIREELQRAFLMRRFERWLGGPTVGVIIASAMFGAGHLLQGADAAIATGLLGAFWAVVYLRRRSVIAPMVSHSGFNLLQLAQFLALGR